MTKENIQEKFNTDYKWLFRGVLAIHNQQTLDEQRTESTNHNNRRGFTSTDAKFLSSIATQIRRGHGLSSKQLFVTRKKMAKYAAQCAKLARDGVKVENFGRIDESIVWTEKKNPKVKSQLEQAHEIVDEINRRAGRVAATVGGMGFITHFDENGMMYDL